MVVTSEGLVGDTEVTVLFFFVQFPDHDGLISGTGDQDRGVFVFLLGETSDDGSDPVRVTFEDTSLDNLDI